MSKMHFKIVTPERVVYEDDVEKISVPTKDGVISIRPDHMHIVSVIEAGELVISKEGRNIEMAITRGFLEVGPSKQVVIMADTAERIEDMDKESIEKARKRAEKALEEAKDEGEVDFARFEEVLTREIGRLKIAEKYKR